ncbi:hypothetical protein Y1Q_0023407 [Alligator mississippiensis]|uniref:Uncharacterized protein n=1 Tax=Alligator mississippiensis TaxID=8496 RepID=A0A151NPY1_ALLMI|nr:hypothetical protein Y1Q_0023407 [Alligator mississippiensis]
MAKQLRQGKSYYLPVGMYTMVYPNCLSNGLISRGATSKTSNSAKLLSSAKKMKLRKHEDHIHQGSWDAFLP